MMRGTMMVSSVKFTMALAESMYPAFRFTYQYVGSVGSVDGTYLCEGHVEAFGNVLDEQLCV